MTVAARLPLRIPLFQLTVGTLAIRSIFSAKAIPQVYCLAIVGHHAHRRGSHGFGWFYTATLQAYPQTL